MTSRGPSALNAWTSFLNGSGKREYTEKKKQGTEHQHQKAVVDWCKWKSVENPVYGLLFAIPNGGYRSKTTAAMLKAEGVQAGVPDLFLAWPKPPYHGLFIEMKNAKGVLRPSQKLWSEKLRHAKYQVKTCFSADEAIKVLEEWGN
jgi:hypothetical protein